MFLFAKNGVIGCTLHAIVSEIYYFVTHGVSCDVVVMQLSLADDMVVSEKYENARDAILNTR